MENNDFYSGFNEELDFDSEVGHFKRFEQEAQDKVFTKRACEDDVLYCSNLEDVTEALRNAGYIKK